MIDFELSPQSGSGGDRPYSGNVTPIRPVSRAERDGAEPAYLSSLNDRQREAVLSVEGPLIVLAGAGSGKTKMLTSRIANLLDRHQVPAYQILAMTFTNKAAAEMRERVERHLAGSHALGAPEIGTFHSICVRLLRREQIHTPFTKQFVIYDDSDQLSLIKATMSKLGVDEKSFSPKGIQAAINRAKCDALEPHEIEPSPHNFFEKQMKRVYGQYQKDLFANNALDFGEIICMTYRLFRDNPELRDKYQRRFRYVHVDEYQDTNRAQYLLLSQLAGARTGGHQNICVVGDEDQSIYKWRGADIRNILDFEQDYPGAKVVKLEQNYRSTQTIITAASQVIRNNRERKDKTLWTENEAGKPIVRAQLPDERAEAELVVSEIKRLAEQEHRTYSDFAILYRTHAQSRQFEDVFRREKIPYQIVGGLRFYDRKEIKDILSYFKILLNPTDSVSLKRIINVPARGIGKTTLDKIEALQTQLEQESAPDATYWGAVQRAARDPSLTSTATARKLAGFVRFVENLADQQPKRLLSELYHLILDETGYVLELRKEATEEATARIENLEEFDTLLQEFEEDLFEKIPIEERDAKKPELLGLFLEQTSLSSEPESKDKGVQGSVVCMMTLHSSKGLEYPVVFLPGMEEGLFPSVRPWEETPEEDIEEERRLCYVGMTRARQLLFLTHVVVRRLWGNVSYQEPARFFVEMPAHLLDFKDYTRGTGSQFRPGSSRQFMSEHPGPVPITGAAAIPPAGRGGYRSSKDLESEFSQVQSSPSAEALIGMRLHHPDYGAGTIVSSEGSGDAQKVVVEFKGRDRRKFLFRFLKAMLEE